MNEIPTIATIALYGDIPQFLIAKDNHLSPLTSAHFAKAIPNYPLLAEKERVRKERKFLDSCDWVGKAHRHHPLSNIKCACCSIDAAATLALLNIGEIFESGVGYQTLALIVAGLHAEALQEIEADFHPILSISQRDETTVHIFSAVANAVVRRKCWKGKRLEIHRSAVANFVDGQGKHFTDFNLVKAKFKHFKKYRTHVQYIDTLVVVVGATSPQIREIVPYIGSCTAILLGCAKGDLDPIRLPSKGLDDYDPEILDALAQHGENIAQLLRLWWEGLEDIERWAQTIVKRAKTTFGKPDTRYVAVRLDPKLLTMAIAYEVLVDFFDFLSDGNYAHEDVINRHRKAAQEVFYPSPVEEVPLRRADDPEVFIEVMKVLVDKHGKTIVPENESYPTRGKKPLGTWCTIGGEIHLVMLEAVFVKEYTKACKSIDELDCQLFDHNDWRLRLQRILFEAGVIKATKSNPRYRFKLLANKAKDETYVVAVPRPLLVDDDSRQNTGQGAENPEMAFASIFDLEGVQKV